MTFNCRCNIPENECDYPNCKNGKDDMTIKTETKIGRLAMREEGEFWCAYYALPDEWERRMLLGSIHMGIIRDKREYRDKFLSMMSDIVADLIEEIVGKRPDMVAEVPYERTMGDR